MGCFANFWILNEQPKKKERERKRASAHLWILNENFKTWTRTVSIRNNNIDEKHRWETYASYFLNWQKMFTTPQEYLASNQLVYRSTVEFPNKLTKSMPRVWLHFAGKHEFWIKSSGASFICRFFFSSIPDSSWKSSEKSMRMLCTPWYFTRRESMCDGMSVWSFVRLFFSLDQNKKSDMLVKSD